MLKLQFDWYIINIKLWAMIDGKTKMLFQLNVQEDYNS